jgi:hypothetical protein
MWIGNTVREIEITVASTKFSVIKMKTKSLTFMDNIFLPSLNGSTTWVSVTGMKPELYLCMPFINVC